MDQVPYPTASNWKSYEDCAQELIRRIEALIPEHPEILDMTNPFGLFKLGLKCNDLDPTLAMASVALQFAKANFRNRTTPAK